MANGTELAAFKDRVFSQISREEVAKIACDLVDIPSPTGYEKACADYINARYQAAGFKVLDQQFDEERANAIAIMKGTGSGPTLMFNGHMDTSYTGDERYLPDRPGYKPKAVIDGDWIYGLGIYNMKGGLAAFIHAAEAVRRAGVEMPGDVVLAAVAGEIEKSQVDHYQGPLYRGGACGTWYSITHGAIADFAVVGEPSGMTLTRAHGGYVWTKVTLVGDPKHTIFGLTKDNSIHNMMKIGRAVEKWGEEYAQRRAVFDMPAKVTLSAIEGGWPYRCSRVPVYCSLYIDTRLLPGQNPLEVQREIESLVRKVHIEDPELNRLHLDIEVFMNQWGSECSEDEYIFGATKTAHEEVMGSAPEITAVPFASDACELVAHGIPALNYGPSGRTRTPAEGSHYGKAESDWNPQQGEHLNIDDLHNTTKVYATLMLNTCMRTREELGLEA